MLGHGIHSGDCSIFIGGNHGIANRVQRYAQLSLIGNDLPFSLADSFGHDIQILSQLGEFFSFRGGPFKIVVSLGDGLRVSCIQLKESGEVAGPEPCQDQNQRKGYGQSHCGHDKSGLQRPVSLLNRLGYQHPPSQCFDFNHRSDQPLTIQFEWG